MVTLICPELANYFFGDLFETDIANNALFGHPNLSGLLADIASKIKEGQPHLGVGLISYLDIDTGFFMCALQRMPGKLSILSFYASSHHRLFSGQTLLCVPLQFCTKFFEQTGEYIVYRHTFKKPLFNEIEIEKIMKTGSEQERVKAAIYTKSRDGYETVPGMSYVGMTKRTWQERYLEHVDKSLKKSGSTLFHKAIREMQGKRVVHVHDVSAFCLSKNEAIEYEKDLIRESTLCPKGLNMKIG